MERCKKIGFRLFQGHFFAHPEIVSGRRLSASQAGLIQLINLASGDSETVRIEEGIKHEPALAINLLRIVNSVGHGLSRRTTSLRHAITLLGRRQLQGWLQLLLMTPAGKTPDASRSPLLQVAALRGRMMEMLIGQSHPRDGKLADQAFITGIMSMMPAALGLPMNEIFEQITLEPEVMEALSSHAGMLGKTLALLECFDADDGQGCDVLLGQLHNVDLDRGTLNTCLMDSLRWVNGNTEGD
ncbi:EAL and HDOD domain-containing protein [Propionivibrio sp.]|uniref:EAL and HDOD domain-containing protein n=1 Tax=Propionivibrio sp. TaxID=2212460 RepID=UPI003BF1220C